MAVKEKTKMLKSAPKIIRNQQPAINVSDLLNNIKKIKDQETIKKPKKISSEEDIMENDPLIYEVADDDDDMVRLVKDEIEHKKITTTDVYNVSSSPSAGYNLIYGLRKHPTMSFKTFQKWAEILGMEVSVSLVEKNV